MDRIGNLSRNITNVQVRPSTPRQATTSQLPTIQQYENETDSTKKEAYLNALCEHVVFHETIGTAIYNSVKQILQAKEPEHPSLQGLSKVLLEMKDKQDGDSKINADVKKLQSIFDVLKQNHSADDIANVIMCQISHDTLSDPVRVSRNGSEWYYSGMSLLDWVTYGGRTCPVTRANLSCDENAYNCSIIEAVSKPLNIAINYLNSNTGTPHDYIPDIKEILNPTSPTQFAGRNEGIPNTIILDNELREARLREHLNHIVALHRSSPPLPHTVTITELDFDSLRRSVQPLISELRELTTYEPQPNPEINLRLELDNLYIDRQVTSRARRFFNQARAWFSGTFSRISPSTTPDSAS